MSDSLRTPGGSSDRDGGMGPTPETTDEYKEITGRLLEAFADEKKFTEPIQHQEKFVRWFETACNNGRWARQTQKKYRTALTHTLREDERFLPEYVQELRNIEASNKNGSKSSQSVRLKRFPQDMFEAIENELHERSKQFRGHWHQPLIHYLHAGMLTGCRPLEWYKAHLDETKDPIELTVKNSKHTAGRAHGPERTLRILDGPIDHLRQWLSIVPDTYDEMRTVYNSCQTLLKRVNRSLWPDREEYPTLKSCRHQFCANAKKAGLGLDEIAALMGHVSDATASESYGMRMYGTDGFAVQPAPEEVNRVRTIYEGVPETLKQTFEQDG